MTWSTLYSFVAKASGVEFRALQGSVWKIPVLFHIPSHPRLGHRSWVCPHAVTVYTRAYYSGPNIPTL